MTTPTSRTAPARRTGRPPADLAPATLDEILTAALRMFADKGYDGASVAALNRQLGVSHNLIHQRFGSKEKLWYAAVDHAFGIVATEMRQEFDDAGGGPMEQLRRIIVRFIHVNARRPEILRLTTVEGVASSPRLDYLYEQHIEPILTEATAPLRQLADEGVIAPVPMRTLYFLVAHGGTALFSLIGLSRLMGPQDPLDPEAVTHHADFVADLVLAGLRNRS
ncbi:TetR/AcrR family transcriptional regulator [Streptomyces sp. NBC_00663]|uniref:TetR/AcrR family transcriptional regulator n=1 Tax=Streptomyces sp. NBC_00663 TaxID=2975801 RepID=UPI002E3679D4|nr:TetR/AcrR family transcriptional regulator [Streptomyces sp. NBC_00663]